MSTARKGHLTALFTILVWGTTFIATKILLADFAPVEILVIRFIMGYFVLLAAYPRGLKPLPRRQELMIMAAGATGVCAYYLLENIALTQTTASNVSVITSTAPFFTAILAVVFLRSSERLNIGFFIGFGCAMAGIAMISFNGSAVTFSPLGDILAVCAAVAWAVYSILIQKIDAFGLPLVMTTRRMFFYGLLFIIPACAVSGFPLNLPRFSNALNLSILLYLGILASAVCFATWNDAVGKIGAVKTNVYIYLIPVITVVLSALILSETLTPSLLGGTALTVAGLFISQFVKIGKRAHARV